MIRNAVKTDLPALVGIYNQAINSRCCTGDTVCFSTEERIPWFEAHCNQSCPIFAYEAESAVVAYSCISSYRPGRQAFERAGEISYYVDFAQHNRGFGSALVKHTMREAKKLEYTHLIAILLDCNVASISLLEKHGFSCWGVMPNIASIDNKRYSHLYYGREI